MKRCSSGIASVSYTHLDVYKRQIDGKAISMQIKEGLKAEVMALKQKGVQPGLAVIIVGDDPASRVYVNLKKRDCEELGILSREYAMPKETSEQELLELIEKLNYDDAVNGILVQMCIRDRAHSEYCQRAGRAREIPFALRFL